MKSYNVESNADVCDWFRFAITGQTAIKSPDDGWVGTAGSSHTQMPSPASAPKNAPTTSPRIPCKIDSETGGGGVFVGVAMWVARPRGHFAASFLSVSAVFFFS
ncbi:MAG TPA: hypothetical protein VK137_15155, partial [Planctomycetaceae bacterium]|nr:hypothetical protein [Planctomycetaceae bacterium]